MNKLNLEGLEFLLKIKDIPKFENSNKLNVNVFELTETILKPIHITTNYDQPQIDLLLIENPYCLITKLHCLINKDSHMKWVCRRCLTEFSSEQNSFDHTSRCTNQQPTNMTFSWKDHFDSCNFECNNQPANESTGDLTRNDQKVFKEIPIAVGFYLISPFGNQYYPYFGNDCVTWFVNEMLIIEKLASKYFETDLELEITP